MAAGDTFSAPPIPSADFGSVFIALEHGELNHTVLNAALTALHITSVIIPIAHPAFFTIQRR
jgi:hypothetical protein